MPPLDPDALYDQHQERTWDHERLSRAYAQAQRDAVARQRQGRAEATRTTAVPEQCDLFASIASDDGRRAA